MILDNLSLAPQILINLALNNFMNPLDDFFLILCLALHHLENDPVPRLVNICHQLLDYLLLVGKIT